MPQNDEVALHPFARLTMMRSMEENTQNLPTLAQLREKIDAVDNAMFDLIEQRCEYVALVGELKQAELEANPEQARCFIRPGREGAMLQRIWQRFSESPFNPAGAVSMWRDVINASITMETPLTLVIAGDAQQPHFWQARNYFGQFIPVEFVADAEAVVARVEEDSRVIGIVPFDERSDALRGALNNLNKGKIFSQLPFLEDASFDGKALAMARIRPEPSGVDITFMLNDGELRMVGGFIETVSEEGAKVIGHSTKPRQLSEWKKGQGDV